ncbi:hypothetical protein QTV44_002485 [Vibrio vulnificus]|nr:hypothetical protein [Vibrio vulnificus]
MTTIELKTGREVLRLITAQNGEVFQLERHVSVTGDASFRVFPFVAEGVITRTPFAVSHSESTIEQALEAALVNEAQWIARKQASCDPVKWAFSCGKRDARDGRDLDPQVLAQFSAEQREAYTYAYARFTP